MKKKLIMIGSMVGSLAPVVVHAEETGSANSAVVTAMTGVANDMVATGNAIVPVALTVVGIGLVVVFGVRIFRKIAR